MLSTRGDTSNLAVLGAVVQDPQVVADLQYYYVHPKNDKTSLSSVSLNRCLIQHGGIRNSTIPISRPTSLASIPYPFTPSFAIVTDQTDEGFEETFRMTRQGQGHPSSGHRATVEWQQLWM